MQQRVRRTFTHFLTSNATLVAAVIFTIGCSILVVNAILSFLPFASSRIRVPHEAIYVEGVLSIFSCVLFLTGSICAYLETVNANQGQLFGPTAFPYNPYGNASEGSLDSESGWTDINLGYQDGDSTLDLCTEKDSKSTNAKTSPEDPPLKLWPTFTELRTQYIFDLRFVANAIFLSSSILYCITAFLSLITILQCGYIATWIRYPQLVAAIGFVLGSIFGMLRAQDKWWKPVPGKLKWQINFWNLVGSAGFVFCAIFGIIEHTYWAKYQFGCSYLWGKCVLYRSRDVLC